MARPYQSDLVDIAGIIVESRPLSIRLNDGTRKGWLPRSQIEIDPTDASAGHSVTVAMPEWLAQGKGVI